MFTRTPFVYLFQIVFLIFALVSTVRCTSGGGGGEQFITGKISLTSKAATYGAIETLEFPGQLEAAKLKCEGMGESWAATGIVGFTIDYKLPSFCKGKSIQVTEITVDIFGPTVLSDGDSLTDNGHSWLFSGNHFSRTEKYSSVNNISVTVATRTGGSVGVSTSDVDCPEPQLLNPLPLGTDEIPSQIQVEVQTVYDSKTATASKYIGSNLYGLDVILLGDEGTCEYFIEFGANIVLD